MQFLEQCLKQAYILNGVIADTAIAGGVSTHIALMQVDYRVMYNVIWTDLRVHARPSTSSCKPGSAKDLKTSCKHNPSVDRVVRP